MISYSPKRLLVVAVPVALLLLAIVAVWKSRSPAVPALVTTADPQAGIVNNVLVGAGDIADCSEIAGPKLPPGC